MKVLIIEDEVSLQQQLVAIIESMDPSNTVDASISADETIDLMHTQRLNPNFGYDLIVSDVSLEGKKTGFDLWRTCSKEYPETKFIFISGISVAEFLDQVKDDPSCPPYLSKPFGLDEFKNVVAEVMNLADH